MKSGPRKNNCTAANKRFCTTGADGSGGSAVTASLSSCSGITRNAELSTNHEHLFLFASSVSRGGHSNNFPVTQSPVRWL